MLTPFYCCPPPRPSHNHLPTLTRADFLGPVEVEQVVEVVVGPLGGGVGPGALETRGEGVLALALHTNTAPGKGTYNFESDKQEWHSGKVLLLR